MVDGASSATISVLGSNEGITTPCIYWPGSQEGVEASRRQWLTLGSEAALFDAFFR